MNWFTWIKEYLGANEIGKYKDFNFFKDPALNEEFVRKGYLVMDANDKTYLDSLKGQMKNIYGQVLEEGLNEDGFMNTINLKGRENKELVASAIKESIPSVFGDLFNNDVVTYPGSFFIKPTGQNTEFPIHQDGAHIDEVNHCGIYAWIPLQDTSVKNGTMHVFPGSHWLKNYQRPLFVEWRFKDFRDIIKKYLVPIDLKEGQFVLTDHSLIHYTSDNLSDALRIAFSYTIMKKDTSYIYYSPSKKNEGFTDIYNVDRDFWINMQERMNHLDSYKKLRSEKLVDTNYSRAQFELLCKRVYDSVMKQEVAA